MTRDEFAAAVARELPRMQTSPGAKWVDNFVTASWQTGLAPKTRMLGTWTPWGS